MGSNNCPACGTVVGQSEEACPKCGQNLRLPDRSGNGVSTSGGAEIIGGAIGLAIPFFGVIFLLNSCNSEDEKTPETLAAETRRIERDREQGLHCLSGWDGSLPTFKEAVKAQLRDPSTFEHMKTIISPKKADNRHDIMMQFRARNGFGGMNVEYAKGSISNTDCSFRIERVGQ